MAAVVGFLIISFGIWGIGDIFRGFGASTVAKVGRTEISAEQFRLRYNEQLQQLGRQAGRPITPEQARAFGLEQQLLGQMIATVALDERARQLRLGISDAELAKQSDRVGMPVVFACSAVLAEAADRDTPECDRAAVIGAV